MSKQMKREWKRFQQTQCKERMFTNNYEKRLILKKEREDDNGKVTNQM